MSAFRTDHWCLYFLECADGSLYTGISNNLPKRLQNHQSGKGGAKYTRARLPVKLVYIEPCANQSAALRRECAVKKYPRQRKLLLAEVFGARSQNYAALLKLTCHRAQSL